MDNSIKILLLEDLPSDALLVKKALTKANVDFEALVVDGRDKYIAALTAFSPDLILADHSLPSFNSIEALKILKQSGLEIPFIVITAAMSDESAVSMLMNGADDYILKDRLSRLPVAISNALEKYRLKNEHQKFLDELIISEQRYRALIEHSADGVVILNAQGKPTYVSVSVTNVLGYLPSEILEMDLFTLMHPDDSVGLGMALGNILANPGKTMKGHTGRMLHKNGSWRWIEATITNLLDDPAVNGIVDNFRDITEKKSAEELLLESERRLDRATTMARVGSFEADPANNTVFWSPMTRQIHEVGPDFIPEMETVMHFYKAGINRDTIVMAIDEIIKQQTPLDLELQIITAKGNERWVRVMCEAELVHGKCILYGSFQDIDKIKKTELEVLRSYEENITERKFSEKKLTELNNDLNQYTNELALSNKGLEQFSYMVSHNLRAPVANIIGLAGLLGDKSYPSELKDDFLNGILKNVKRLDVVITDLNSILQIKKEIGEKSESVNFQELVDNIKEGIQNLMRKENVRIITNFEQDHELFTLKTYLYSIFDNLISNSIKYHRAGLDPVIEIKSSVSDGKLTLSFKDNGLGIDLAKKREQLFGLYKRFHHHVEGKGMGLFMVKTQVEILGGTISVLSEINKGLSF